ncbi:hypothetical protein ACQEVG_16705 [Streptomyces sp. CA-135486]|uniref:hypothetical protein n=1 Tax=Streptomyces sp. CA-135486 TaxID=3240049 RepID=UPI003D904DC2
MAESRFNEAGRQGKWVSDPMPWSVIKGLIAACYVANGRGSEWQTVTAAYSDVKGHPSGSCKYTAAFKVLKRLATFRMEHPDGKVVFRDAPAGSPACKNEITEHGSLTVRQGDNFYVRGTWPVPVSLYFNEINAPVKKDGGTDSLCCHKATVSVDVPDNLPLGEAKVSLRGEGNSFFLAGPTVEVLPPISQP